MKTFLAIAILPLFFASCAQQGLTGDSYSRSEAGQAQTVKNGRITSIRYVKIEGGTTAGTILGGVAGGVLGNQIGGGAGVQSVSGVTKECVELLASVNVTG